MNFQPTQSGGRRIQGDTPHGAFSVEWDAEGNLLAEWIAIRDPSQPQPEQPAKPAPAPQKPQAIGPGTWLYHAIQAATFGRVQHGIQCEKRRQAMNQAGWKGLPGLLWQWLARKMREVQR